MLLSDPPTARRLRLGGVTRCMCALRLIQVAPQPAAAGPGPLPSRGLFLNRASVRRHIAASKNCRAADLGYREIQVEALAGDVMAGVGGAACPVPIVRHQPPGDAREPRLLHIVLIKAICSTNVLTLTA